MKSQRLMLLKLVLVAAALSLPASTAYARSMMFGWSGKPTHTRAEVPNCDDLNDEQLANAADGCIIGATELTMWCDAVNGGMSSTPEGPVCSTND